MAFWSKENSKERDEERQRRLSKLFEIYDKETDPDKQAKLLKQIRSIQDEFKETEKKKHKWWFIK